MKWLHGRKFFRSKNLVFAARSQYGQWQDTEEDAELIILEQQMERLKGSNSILRSSIFQIEEKVTGPDFIATAPYNTSNALHILSVSAARRVCLPSRMFDCSIYIN